MQSNDLQGKRLYRLSVIQRADSIKGRTAWLCKCDCGNEKVVQTKHLDIADIFDVSQTTISRVI